jgi:outer membrane immunogenic protein
MRTTIATISATAILAAAIVGTACGADLEMPVKAAAAPAFNWSGIYFGVNGGGAWGRQDPFNALTTNRFDPINVNFSGGQVGGTAGAQFQVSFLLIGVEAELDWAGIKGSSLVTPSVFGVPQPFSFNATTNIDWDFDVRLRVGYAVNNWLFFTTGGVVLLGAETNLTSVGGVNPCATVTTIAGTPGILTCHGFDKRIGGTLGAGVEYGFTPNWSAKIEYRYIAAASLELSQVNQVLAGINYRFGLTP